MSSALASPPRSPARPCSACSRPPPQRRVRRAPPASSTRPARSCPSRLRFHTKPATWSTSGSCRTCAGSPSATRSTSPTATRDRCPTANTSAATNATPKAPITTTASPSTWSRSTPARNATPSWAPITRLALWAEPVQGEPLPPFRWVGYDGDAGHGCGNHLHLSWNHAPAAQFELAEWVEVFPVEPGEPIGVPRGKRSPAPKPPPGPSGGISTVRTGGLGPRFHD